MAHLPIVGFPDPQQPDFAALLPLYEPGERFYCDAWSGPAPSGMRRRRWSWPCSPARSL
jgi:hypothetical protein